MPVAKLEAALLDLAALCGVHVPAHEVLFDDVLLVQRFDRCALSSEASQSAYMQFRRDGFLSARTLLYGASGSNSVYASYAQFANFLGRYVVDAKQDRIELYRRMVFNVAIGNTDDHDRNHGILAGDWPGTYALSPAYDLVPVLHQTHIRHQAMIVGGDQSVGTVENLLQDCNYFGLSEAQAMAIIEEVDAIVQQEWRACLHRYKLSDAAVERVAGCFRILCSASDEQLHAVPRLR